jgi:carbamoyltransferase
LYSAFTYYTGFKVNSGEYKMMGLAPYGQPRYAETIREHLVDVKPDGTFRLDMRYFEYATGLRMTSRRFDDLFGGPARRPDDPIDQRTMDIAASIQQVTDQIVLQLARTLRRETGQSRLCMAGGVALNCVSNGLLVRERVFDDVWIQPAAGDAGGAIGAALYAWHARNGTVPRAPATPDGMAGALLGPACTDEQVRTFLDGEALPHEQIADEDALADRVAGLLAAGAVVGWVQGRMEFGPRALGARSILADPRSVSMQRDLNLKIKFRESFRPFAPAVLAERAQDFFELDGPSPYMLVVAPVRGRPQDAAGDVAGGFARLKSVRSALPAVTHVDYSARVQTVAGDDSCMNPRFRRLIDAFGSKTGTPVLVNTSFNVRGEPIVCTLEDAYRCFMATAIDYLVLGNCVLDRRAQPAGHRLTSGAQRTFEAD